MQFYTDLSADFPWLNTFLALLLLIVGAVFVNFVIKVALVRLLHHFLSRLAFLRGEDVVRSGVIARLANVFPAMVLSYGIHHVPGLPEPLAIVVSNVSNAFIILVLALALSAVLNLVDTIYHRRAGAGARPIKGYLQVAKIAVFVVAALMMAAEVIDRSPFILLSGLGALTAVLILVFQDTLLSLVAAIQISSTDMLKVGDWIEMPGMNADGDVIEIALHTVKVQNWDKTVTTVPIRKLVTEPFKNWRGMQESGGRRIKRALYIDQSSIRFLTEDERVRLSALVPLADYVTCKTRELADWNTRLGEKARMPANTRRMTNIGTFRAYVEGYLKSHPGVHQGMTMLVRQLAPTPEGLPLEIYCFTNTIAWAGYEGIQSDIFDHLYAVLPEFGLHVFQNPAGQDFSRFLAAPRLVCAE